MTQLSVCIGSACHLKGAYNVISTFQHLIEERGLHEKIAFSAKFCTKECHKPAASSVKRFCQLFHRTNSRTCVAEKKD